MLWRVILVVVKTLGEELFTDDNKKWVGLLMQYVVSFMSITQLDIEFSIFILVVDFGSCWGVENLLSVMLPLML